MPNPEPHPPQSGYQIGDYTPMFIGQILDTVGGHFDRHQISHNDLAAALSRLEKKVDILMATFDQFVSDFNSFVSDVKSAFTSIEAANTSLQAQLATAIANGTAPADLQPSVDAMEAAITDARTAITAAPAVPSAPTADPNAPAPPVT